MAERLSLGFFQGPVLLQIQGLGRNLADGFGEPLDDFIKSGKVFPGDDKDLGRPGGTGEDDEKNQKSQDKPV
ncbi:MAG: hypothetical protein NT009_13730 [Proteobacteria bacterium]|nr:hypothetical protein [Pseudomonadota bacterium]